MEEEVVKIKFRLYDGSDIGPLQCTSGSTVTMLKERIVSDWPQGKRIIPKTANDVRLICGGKILENNKTVKQCRTPFDDLVGGVITIHVVVQPSITKTMIGNKDELDALEKKVEKPPRKAICSCSIL